METEPLELNKARQLSLDLARPKGVEWVRLEDGLGRVLAETLRVDRDIPAEGRSRYDGYALRSSDFDAAPTAGPVSMKILPGVVAAGHIPERDLEPGTCIRIMTGAPIPEGADIVLPQEDVSLEGDRLIVERSLIRRSGVILPGADFHGGELLLAAGKLLTPTRLALAAALGHSRIPVYQRPVIALLATGDEVREIGQTEEGPWIFCNNRHLLGWLTSLQGARAVHLGIVRDNPEAIAECLKDVDADFVVTTGGIGQGDKDYILEAWEAIGTRILFRHVNISPGRNSALGVRDSQVFLALPGNPWGAQLVFQELAVPALWRSQGMGNAKVPSIGASLRSTLRNKSKNHRAIRGSLEILEETITFTPAKGKGSSFPTLLTNSFAYIILEPHVIEITAGSKVQVRFHDFPILASPVLGYET